MKRFTILLALMVTTGALYAQGTLTVTFVVSTPVTGITVITYDLQTAQVVDKVNETYDIAVEVNFNDGMGYLPVPPAHLSGDVMGVTPGEGKQITWNGGASFPNRYSTETKVRLTANTVENFICGTTTVFFIYNGNPVTYGTVQSSGKCWLDRNLGASQVVTKSNGTAAYGDLFQWGRRDDGHQDRASTTTSTLSTTDVPGHGNFILATAEPYDWRSGQNANLWQGVSGVNNPCPPGYRVPTAAEWQAEINSWVTPNADGAYNSPLQLPVAGYRDFFNGSLFFVGSFGYYWSSTVGGIDSRNLYFGSNVAFVGSSYRAFGYSVRCLKH